MSDGATSDLFVIDDDLGVLDALKLGFGADGISLETFTNASRALEVLSAGRHPRCIISDIRMPAMSGLEFQDRLKALAVNVPLILMTGHGDVQMAVSALKAGAFDFVEKPFDWDALKTSVRNAITEASRNRARDANRMDLQSRVAQLSDRQRQVMDLAVLGFSNKEIAQKLEIGPRTVESYRASLMEKIGASNLAELVRMALELQNE